jgi:hypothetical protein
MQAIRFTAAALILVVLPVGTGAAIPGSDDPKTYTYHTYRKEREEFGRRTLVEAYKTVGKRDPRWDAQAVEALEKLAKYLGDEGLETIYKADPVLHDDVLKPAEAAVAAGCDDPMVLYAKGAMLQDTRRFDEARPVLDKALNLAKASKYPPHRVGSIASRLTRFYNLRDNPADGPAVEALKKTALEFFQKSVSKAAVGETDHRHIVSAMEDEFDRAPLVAKQKFVATIAADPQTDPWMLHYLKGRLHIKQAWAARGSGLSNTVTQQGWATFLDELAKAREHLTGAAAAATTPPRPRSVRPLPPVRVRWR